MSKFRSNKEWLNNLFFEHSALQAVVVMAIIIAVGLGFGVIVVGTLMALLFSKLGHIPMGDMVGILCGATTNTPALNTIRRGANVWK